MLIRWIKRTLFIGLLGAVSIAWAAEVPVPVVAGQKLGFMSSNPITFKQLITQEQPTPQPVWGYLSLPKVTGKQKVPAVVIMAGSGGLKTWYDRYVRMLNEQGIATFQVDSFTPRGISGVASDQAQLPVPMLVADAYGALQYLAKEPNIDAKRIAIMGWSLGGLVSITTAFEDLNEHRLNDKQHFAAHIAFYPPCNLSYPDDRLDGSPWLYLHGSADDYTQPADCLNLISKVRNSAVITAVLYPGARHAFDDPRPVTWLPDVQNPKNCHGVLASDWSLTEQTTGAAINTPADYQKVYSGCMLRGAHLGHDKAASDDALWQVRTFVQHNLLSKDKNNSL